MIRAEAGQPEALARSFDAGRTRVAFTIDFEFRSRLLQILANSMLERALMRLSQAFIDRADALYGVTGGSAPSRPSQPI